MALTLDKINQLRKARTSTVKYNSSEESRPFESVKKGDLKNPNENKLQKIDQKLEKIEKHTEKLIEKHSKSSANNNNVIIESSPSHNKKTHTATKKEPSYIEFLCLKGIPGLIAKHISKTLYFDKTLGKNICIVDTEELIKSYHKKVSANEIANAIWRMKASGWFEVLSSKNNGMRIISISNISFYKSH